MTANGLQLLGEYLCGRVPEMFCWFQSSLSFIQEGFYCLQASKTSKGKGHTGSHMVLCWTTYLPFGALYKKLYLVCREDDFSKQRRTVITVWKHDRFWFNATDPDTVRGWNAQRLGGRHLAQILPGHVYIINGDALLNSSPLGPPRFSSSRNSSPDPFLLAQPAAGQEPAARVSLLALTRPVFLFYSQILCLQLLLQLTPFLVLVAPGLCLTEEICFPPADSLSLQITPTYPCNLVAGSTLRTVQLVVNKYLMANSE